MALGFRQLTAIAGNAVAEILRAPLFCLVLLTALLLAGVVPTLDYLSFLQKERLVTDSLLALTTLGGVFAAASSAVAVVGDELRRRTALVVLSKPVSRGTFLAGKLVGVAAALAVFWVPLAVSVVWGARIAADDYHPDLRMTWLFYGSVATGLLVGAGANYFAGRSFGMTAALALTITLPAGLAVAALAFPPGPGDPPMVQWHYLPAAALCYPAMLLAGGVGVAAACWLEATPTLLVTLLVFCGGLVADYLLGRHAGSSPLAAALYRLLPNWQPFWVSDRVAAGEPAGWAYALRATGYALVWVAGLASLTLAVFERRELG